MLDCSSHFSHLSIKTFGSCIRTSRLYNSDLTFCQILRRHESSVTHLSVRPTKIYTCSKQHKYLLCLWRQSKRCKRVTMTFCVSDQERGIIPRRQKKKVENITQRKIITLMLCNSADTIYLYFKLKTLIFFYQISPNFQVY